MNRKSNQVKSKLDKGTRQLRADETRRTLIATARELFATRGYHDVGIREIAEQANVTRGSLYHHFGEKEALFLAVFDEVEREMVSEGSQDSQNQDMGTPWVIFRGRIQEYLDKAMQPEVQRITLIDAPSVLGWARWRKLEEKYGLSSINDALSFAVEMGAIKPQPIEPLAHLIFGSVMEAALLIAHSDDQITQRKEIGRALDNLLKGLE